MIRPNPFHILLAQRGWQAGAGLVSAGLASLCLSPAGQGWYYAFLSLSAISVLFDAGFSLVLVQAAAKNSLGPDALGANARLARRALAFYGLATVAYVLACLGLGGLIFGARDAAASGDWVAPWLALTACAALNLWLTPLFALEEGAGSLARVYLVRLAQGVAGACATWAGLAAGSLWACAAAPAAACIVALAWLWTIRRSPLWRAVLSGGGGGGGGPGAGLWALHGRVAVSSISGYLLVQAAAPILFRLHSAEDAGRMGLSLAVANMVGVLAQSAIATQVPALTRLAGRKDWVAFDHTFRAAMRASVLLFAGLCVPLAGLRFLIAGEALDQRLLAPGAFVALLAAVFLGHVTGALAAQMRSCDREPLAGLSLGAAVLSLLLALAAAPRFGAPGLAACYLAVQALAAPAAVLIWRRQTRALRA